MVKRVRVLSRFLFRVKELPNQGDLLTTSQRGDKFNDWGGRGCNIFVPVLRGSGTKIGPTGDRFDQPPGQMR